MSTSSGQCSGKGFQKYSQYSKSLSVVALFRSSIEQPVTTRCRHIPPLVMSEDEQLKLVVGCLTYGILMRGNKLETGICMVAPLTANSGRLLQVFQV